MKNFFHYLMMWLVFSFLFTLAVVGVELLEGYKITSSQYYGLRNLGGMLILLALLLCMVLYPLLLLPLTLLVHRWIRLFPIQLLIYGCFGGACGMWVFNWLYNDPPNHSYIDGYGLNRASAIILFALVGLFYGLADH
ncbi:MAG: hypothetical protein ACI33P_12895, partial [Lysinibacillus sp.]